MDRATQGCSAAKHVWTRRGDCASALGAGRDRRSKSLRARLLAGRAVLVLRPRPGRRAQPARPPAGRGSRPRRPIYMEADDGRPRRQGRHHRQGTSRAATTAAPSAPTTLRRPRRPASISAHGHVVIVNADGTAEFADEHDARRGVQGGRRARLRRPPAAQRQDSPPPAPSVTATDLQELEQGRSSRPATICAATARPRRRPGRSAPTRWSRTATGGSSTTATP